MVMLEAATATDTGREREINEDRVWAQIYQPSEGAAVGLFIVCDGIGGHLGGENASHWAVETIRRELDGLFCPPDPRGTILLSQLELESDQAGVEITRQSSMSKVENLVRQAVQRANQVVHDFAQNKPETSIDSGTTISMAVTLEHRAIVANVGDSRTYLIRSGRLRQITQDHSVVASLVASGQIKPSEIYTHPQRNLIYRSLGQKSEVQIDTFYEALRPGDYLLLCTDGLWEMVREEKTISQIITRSETLQQACRQLVEAANKAGGNDNIGVVLVKVS
jgi:protein phosphatase